MASVSLKLKTKVELQDVIEAWQSFMGEPQQLMLPFAPKKPVHYLHEHHFPQPKLHRHLDKGMCATIGRLRKCPLMDFKFSLLSHNTIRGAAGGAVLCAELMVRKGHVFW